MSDLCQAFTLAGGHHDERWQLERWPRWRVMR